MLDARDFSKFRKENSSKVCSLISSSSSMETSPISQNISIMRSKDSWQTTDWLRAIWKTSIKRLAEKWIRETRNNKFWRTSKVKDLNLRILASLRPPARGLRDSRRCLWIDSTNSKTERVKLVATPHLEERNLHLVVQNVSFNSQYPISILF